MGKSQPELGEIAGVLKQAQLKYEKGVRFPDAAYLAAIAKVGADVRYIITEQREGPAPEALSADERELLALFRAASSAVKAAAIGALKSGSAPRTIKRKTVVHGDVGNQMEDNNGKLTINMGNGKK